MNVVGLSNGEFVELQASGEEATYSRNHFNSLMDCAEIGLSQLFNMQNAVLEGIE
jgi:ribonuclease PH